MAGQRVKAIQISVELTEQQYAMLQDCLQTAEVHWRSNATAMDSTNTQYANRIKYLGEMIEKVKQPVYD